MWTTTSKTVFGYSPQNTCEKEGTAANQAAGIALMDSSVTKNKVLLILVLSLAQCGSSAISPKADLVIMIKHEHKLMLMHGQSVLKTYSVALGPVSTGAKERQGDHRTPEGLYVFDSRNAHSHFYKAIHISYLAAEDRKRAARLGVSPGGDVFIHGLPNSLWLYRCRAPAT